MAENSPYNDRKSIHFLSIYYSRSSVLALPKKAQKNGHLLQSSMVKSVLLIGYSIHKIHAFCSESHYSGICI